MSLFTSHSPPSKYVTALISYGFVALGMHPIHSCLQMYFLEIIDFSIERTGKGEEISLWAKYSYDQISQTAIPLTNERCTSSDVKDFNISMNTKQNCSIEFIATRLAVCIFVVASSTNSEITEPNMKYALNFSLDKGRNI